MNDISDKPITKRVARAEGKIKLSAKAYKILLKEASPKGKVLEAAKIAGIMAVKHTPLLVPYCHPLTIEKVGISFEKLKTNTIKVTAEVSCAGKTGVEMEALCAVSAACLTIYDMMKFAGQDMSIEDIKLVYKSGGKSGTFQR